MLCWTSDPVRQTTRKACCSITTSCWRQGSRTSAWKAPQQRANNAASAPLQAATAHTGSHGACASAAAAAAPMVVQEVFVQAADEAHCQRHAQRHIDVEQMQLQHPDQVLLHQQLEHLHQQQHLQQQQQQQQQHWQHLQQQELHPWRPLPQHDQPHHNWGQDWQRRQTHAWWPQQQHQQQPLQDLEPVQQSGRGSHSAYPGLSNGNTHWPADVASGELQLQHNMLTQPVQPGVTHGPQIVAAGHTAGTHETAVQPGSSGVDSVRSHSRADMPVAHTQTATPSFFAALRPATIRNQKQQLQSGGSSDNSVWPSEAIQPVRQGRLSQQHQQQQARPTQVQQQLGRTAAGVALVRLHKGSKPSQVAALLHSCLLQEQRVVLSAAGAQLALVALKCLERTATLQQQQLPGSLLLAVPHHKSSKRPNGLGRCQVYDITCSLQHGVLKQTDQQLPQQQLEQHELEQTSHTAVDQVVLPVPQPDLRPENTHVREDQQRLLSQQQLQHQQHGLAGAPAAQQQQAAHRSWQQHTAGPEQQASSSSWLPKGDSRARGSRNLVPLPQQQQQQQQVTPAQVQVPPQHTDVLLASHEQPARAHLQLQQQLSCCGNGNGWHSHHYPGGQQLLLHEVSASSACLQQETSNVATMHQAAHVQKQQAGHGRQQADDQQQQQQQLLLHTAKHQPRQQRQQLGTQAAGLSGDVSAPAATESHYAAPAALNAASMRRSVAAADVDPAAAAGVDLAPAMPVQLLKVSGCSIDLADALDDALLGSACVVALPVAHPKQAMRTLEAASLVGRRWRQRHQQQQQQQLVPQQRAGGDDSSAAGATMQPQLQLVVQPRRGKVPGKCGSLAGLHVFVYAAPLVQ